MGSLVKIHTPDVWRTRPRWQWEETGRVAVVSQGKVEAECVSRVAAIIHQLLVEFVLPLEVISNPNLKLTETVANIMNQTKSGKDLDVTRLVDERNKSRAS